jgi:hypothetical protein
MGDITVAEAGVIGRMGLFQLAVWGALGIGVIALVTQLAKGAKRVAVRNPEGDVLFRFSASPHSPGWSLIRVETPSGQTMGYVTRLPDGFAAQLRDGTVVGGKKRDPYEAAWALYAHTRKVGTEETLPGFAAM